MSSVEMMTDEEDKYLKDIRMKKIKLTKYGLNFANVCCKLVYDCKLRSNGMPVPLLRNCYSIFNGTKYR